MSKDSVYNRLKAIDVRPKAEKKGRADYLSWAHAWDMLKSIYPDAQRVIYEQPETGLNYFTDGKTAYVKVGIVVNDLEHIDMLCVMDHRNKSITLDKLCSFEVNKTIQRATAKAIAMHGLGLSLWTGEDVQSPPPEAKEAPSKEPKQRISLEVDDENWAKVLKYVVANKELGIDQLLKNLRTKYKVSTKVQKALKDNIG
tara:strand:+ start:6235 stop:6831 length:597 start_codon:yes stop_codon:yes gene_type:complete